MVPDPTLSRRRLLQLGAAGTAATAGCSSLLDGPPTSAKTTPVSDTEARRLAETYAPTLYFGAGERWYPTDPRPYAEDRDGETVVSGFTALDQYTREFRESGEPPRPSAFYHALSYPDSPLSVVQFWFYSVFDQFSTNFHWHDWEVLHVFVDTERNRPVLFVASAHAPKVPNNEFLDPERDRANVLSEVGSHSSALGVNAREKTFQRFGIGDLVADVNNHALEVTEGGQPVPLAYGLPRDEGFALPYVVPELDGEPVYEHERLPNVTADDLLPDELTVHSYLDLATPPKDLPKRESATTFVPATRTATGDHDYALEPISAVQGIDDLAGPQLSFQFYVPKFAENAVASHLTTTDLPWTQARFDQPAADITDPRHRQAMADRYEPIRAEESLGELVGAIRQQVTNDDAPTNNGAALLTPTVEVVALLESDPTPVPSFGGVLAVSDPPAGDHQLTVNGAGMAPYAEELTYEGGAHRVGVEGKVSTPANEDAVKLRGDATEPGLASLTVEDDFAGPLYDGTPPGDDRFGVYVHRAGAYTADVTDPQGERGAVRVNPDPDETEVLARMETGKAPLADYLRRFVTETRLQAAVFEDGDDDGITEVSTGTDLASTDVADAVSQAKENLREAKRRDEPGGGATTDTSTGTVVGDDFAPGTGFTGLLRALDAALLAANRAHEAAAAGNAARADRQLESLAKRLDTLAGVVEKSELAGSLGEMVANRIRVMRSRVEAAVEASVD